MCFCFFFMSTTAAVFPQSVKNLKTRVSTVDEIRTMLGRIFADRLAAKYVFHPEEKITFTFDMNESWI